MAILKKNPGSGSTLECNLNNKETIVDRVQETNTDLDVIRTEIARYRTKVQTSSDTVIQGFTHASSFPIADIVQLLNNNPDAGFLRVYNALTESNEHICYIAAVDEDFNTY